MTQNFRLTKSHVKMKLLIITLIITSLFCFVTNDAVKRSESVEKSQDGENGETFVATNEWQVVKKGCDFILIGKESDEILGFFRSVHSERFACSN